VATTQSDNNGAMRRASATSAAVNIDIGSRAGAISRALKHFENNAHGNSISQIREATVGAALRGSI